MLEHLKASGSVDELVRSATFSKAFRSARDRRKVLRYLARERVGELSVEARVALVDMLQKGFTRRYQEEAIRDLFLATTGADLTRMKRMIDRGLDHRDLVQLIYHDIDSASLRREILAHIQSAAVPCPEWKVISDVDDTFYRNWVDPRWPSRTVYPGVVQLFKELEGDIVFLTGRPGERSGALERRFRRGLHSLGGQHASMLTGSFVHQFFHPWVFSRKWRNFERYRELFPEMPIVMFGDSGQADPEFIARALERHPEHVRAGLVHRVKPLPPERLERVTAAGVVLFDTYVGAALHLRAMGYLADDAVRRVAEAAQADFARIRFKSEEMKQARQVELAVDVGRVGSQV